MHYANNGTYRRVSVIYWRTALALLGYSPTLGEEVVEEPGFPKRRNFRRRDFPSAETKINQNCIAPRSRITFWSCFCATDALHVSPTWNSSAVHLPPEPRLENWRASHEELWRNSRGAKKKRGSATLYFAIEFYPEIFAASSRQLSRRSSGLLENLSSRRVVKYITCSSQSRVIFRVKENYLPYFFHFCHFYLFRSNSVYIYVRVYFISTCKLASLQ